MDSKDTLYTYPLQIIVPLLKVLVVNIYIFQLFVKIGQEEPRSTLPPSAYAAVPAVELPLQPLRLSHGIRTGPSTALLLGKKTPWLNMRICDAAAARQQCCIFRLEPHNFHHG